MEEEVSAKIQMKRFSDGQGTKAKKIVMLLFSSFH